MNTEYLVSKIEEIRSAAKASGARHPVMVFFDFLEPPPMTDAEDPDEMSPIWTVDDWVKSDNLVNAASEWESQLASSFVKEIPLIEAFKPDFGDISSPAKQKTERMEAKRAR